jgi:hypothetical protein
MWTGLYLADNSPVEGLCEYDPEHGYFCDQNAVPDVLSQKDASQNGIPEPFSWH